MGDAAEVLNIDADFPKKLEDLFYESRYKILWGGRGGAKSWGIARALLLLGVEYELRILCAREFQNSIKDSVHQLLADQVYSLHLDHIYNVKGGEIVSRLNGTKFGFEGLKQNISRIKSYEGVDIVWIEEAHVVSKNSMEVLIPTIRKEGSEIWMSLNPEFEDDYVYENYVVNPPEDSIIININWRDNPWFPDVLNKERLALKKKDPDSYDHVWEGQCRQWLEGAIYGKELKKVYQQERVCEVEWDSNAYVSTAWDLGRTDDTAIWWYQIIGGEIHVIDCYASNEGSLSEYATHILGNGKWAQINLINGEVIVEIRAPKDDEERGIVEASKHRKSWVYEKHWLPHDAKAKTLQAAGKSTIIQLAEVLGKNNMAIVPSIGLEDGIQATRTMFPRIWFDKEKTADGLKALRKYRRELQTDEVSLRAKPSHDWTSHYADAFRM